MGSSLNGKVWVFQTRGHTHTTIYKGSNAQSQILPLKGPLPMQASCNVLFCLGIEDKPANLYDSHMFERALTVRESVVD